MRRGLIRLRGVGWSAVASAVALTTAFIIGTVAWEAAMRSVPGPTTLQSAVATSIPVLLVVVCLAMVTTLAILARAHRMASAVELATFPAMLWTLLAVVSALTIPGTSWITTWPAAGAAIALALATRRAVAPTNLALLTALAAVPSLVLVPPVLWQFQVAMTNRVVPLCAAVVALITLPLVIPLAQLVQPRGTR